MNTKNEMPVQPELLWVDQKNLKKEEINLLRAQTALNKFIKECENVLGVNLSDELKHELKDIKINALMNEIRKGFTFPNATEDFNLQSLGIDLTTAKRLQSAEHWELYQFELNDNGDFIGSENQKMFNQFYYYAKSEKRKKALQLADKLVELTNEATALGFINVDHLNDVSFAYRKLVMVEGKPGSPESKLMVNKEGIAVSLR